jgi:hypothetical protein
MRVKIGNRFGYGIMEGIDAMEMQNEQYPNAVGYATRRRVIEMARRSGAKKIGKFSIHCGSQVTVEYLTDLELAPEGG